MGGCEHFRTNTSLGTAWCWGASWSPERRDLPAAETLTPPHVTSFRKSERTPLVHSAQLLHSPNPSSQAWLREADPAWSPRPSLRVLELERLFRGCPAVASASLFPRLSGRLWEDETGAPAVHLSPRSFLAPPWEPSRTSPCSSSSLRASPRGAHQFQARRWHSAPRPA